MKAGPPKKRVTLAELKQQLGDVLAELEVDNAWLRMHKIIEQAPVAERIERLASIMAQLMARKQKIRLDVSNWAPELLHELRLNKGIGPKIEQMELKEELLKKHKKKFKQRKIKKRVRRRLPG